MQKIYTLIICILLFLFGFLFNGCQNNNPNDNIYVPPELDVTYSKGNANAKVVIIEYSDYQCPFCSRFTLDILPLLQNDYIETGKVQFIFKDFPIPNHKYAEKASEATYCAGEQNEDYFWKMHVKLFEKQKNLEIKDLEKYAEEMGLNMDAFRICLENDKYKNLILRNRNEGLRAGVEGTPTIFINNIKLAGLPAYENLKKIIDLELNK
jgi:protein-disulfide isomerase